MRHWATYLASFALFALSAVSQTVTTTDAAGETIVEVITLDPVLGVPSTQVLQTLTAVPTTAAVAVTSAAVTTAPAITTPAVQQGPVGQPAPTNGPAPPTVYTYTTTDANGAFTAVVDTFTPNFPASVTPTPSVVGTILQYSQWLSLVGTSTAAPQHGSGAVGLWDINRLWLTIASGVITGVLGGVWLLLV